VKLEDPVTIAKALSDVEPADLRGYANDMAVAAVCADRAVIVDWLKATKRQWQRSLVEAPQTAYDGLGEAREGAMSTVDWLIRELSVHET
jgi:hypothetical protein